MKVNLVFSFQVYEMWESGWTFKVLSPVFAVHYGFQEKRGRPAWREMQNNRNRKKLDRFKAEVQAKHKKLERPKPTPATTTTTTATTMKKT